MERMLTTLSGSLRDVLLDVEQAQDLLHPELDRAKQQREAERQIQQILRSVEDNLSDTVVGLRMVTHGRDKVQAE